MQNKAWMDFFSGAVARAGYALSEQQCGRFLCYMLELIAWNRTTNITRIVEPHAIAIKHFLDSILITRYIDITQKTIADVGSGGGFPGIPLAILEPACRVILIESAGKKCAFLSHAVRTLQLTNVTVYNGRAEAYPAPQTCDLAISRALASLSDFTAVATRLIKPQGWIVSMKGRLPLDEIAALKTRYPGLPEPETQVYCLPEQGDARSLVVVRPCFT